MYTSTCSYFVTSRIYYIVASSESSSGVRILITIRVFSDIWCNTYMHYTIDYLSWLHLHASECMCVGRQMTDIAVDYLPVMDVFREPVWQHRIYLITIHPVVYKIWHVSCLCCWRCGKNVIFSPYTHAYSKMISFIQTPTHTSA